MNSKDEILDLLKNLKEQIRKKYKVKKIGLFGSYIANTQNSESDVDILVEFEDNADLFDFSGLGLFLEEKLGQKVDLVPKNALKPELKTIILNQVIYS